MVDDLDEDNIPKEQVDLIKSIVNDLIDEMGELGLKYVVIISAGFKEVVLADAPVLLKKGKLRRRPSTKLQDASLICVT